MQLVGVAKFGHSTQKYQGLSQASRVHRSTQQKPPKEKFESLLAPPTTTTQSSKRKGDVSRPVKL